jgi:hypothetical protein
MEREGGETKVTNVVFRPPSEEVVLDVTIEDPVYKGPGSVVDT